MKQSLFGGLGKEVRLKRLDKGLTQKDLARLAKVTESTISYVESDSKNCSVKTLTKIAIALDTTVDNLLPPYRTILERMREKETAPSVKKESGKESEKPQTLMNALDEAHLLED
jgi:transcriptional regulator with XRE-family HTH domain